MHRYANYTNVQFITTVTEGTFKVHSIIATNMRGFHRKHPQLVRLMCILGDPGSVSRAGRKGATKVFKHRRKSPWARSIQPKFRPVRPGKEDRLKRRTCFFETFPVGPNRSIEFWTEISGNFGWMDRAPWVPTLTGPFPNGQANAGSWLGIKNALYYYAQSANSIFWVLFVSSHRTAIDSITACLAHAPKKRTQESFSLI